MRTGADDTSDAMERTRNGSTTRSTRWVTPCSSVNSPRGSPAAMSASVSCSRSDSPHTGDMFVRVARVRSSRSVVAFGVVRSWGNTPSAPSSTTSRAPITPTVFRRSPRASTKLIRYRVNDGRSSNCRTPRSRHAARVAAACSYGWSPTGRSIATMLWSCSESSVRRSASLSTSYGGAVTNERSWSGPYRSARNGTKVGTEQDWQVDGANPSSVGCA